MKTYLAKPKEVPAKWWVVDAQGKVLGRVATRIADTLRGKNKPAFTPHTDTGDFVVVVNAEKIRLTGKKLDQKIYYRSTGYVGHLKSTPARKMLKQKPEDVLRLAVKGMLPKNKLRPYILKKLKIYAGPEHPHSAQKPEPMSV
jgi:large subunit ribosomal protein L13